MGPARNELDALRGFDSEQQGRLLAMKRRLGTDSMVVQAERLSPAEYNQRMARGIHDFVVQLARAERWQDHPDRISNAFINQVKGEGNGAHNLRRTMDTGFVASTNIIGGLTLHPLVESGLYGETLGEEYASKLEEVAAGFRQHRGFSSPSTPELTGLPMGGEDQRTMTVFHHPDEPFILIENRIVQGGLQLVKGVMVFTKNSN